MKAKGNEGRTCDMSTTRGRKRERIWKDDEGRAQPLFVVVGLTKAV